MSDPITIQKGACVKCGGHIAFPAEAAGSKIPCPHCRALTPLLAGEEVESRLYYKCACSLCWGRLKYPAENIGNSVTCPHCGSQTTLVAPGSQKSPPSATQTTTAASAAAPPAPSSAAAAPASSTLKTPPPRTATAAAAPGQVRAATPPAGKVPLKFDRPEPAAKSKLSKQAVIAIVVAAVVVGLGIAAAALVPKLKGRGKPTPGKQTQSGGASGSSAGPMGELQLLENRFHKANDSGLIFVLGTVTNHTKVQFYNLKIEFELFDDAGTKVGTATDLANNLEGGKTWLFKAPVLDKQAAAAKLSSLKWEK